MKHPRQAAPGVLVLALLGLMTALPAALDAQEPMEAPDRERLTLLARVHMAINDARDEFHGQVARVHDAEGRQRAREEVDAKIEAILEEHEVTREAYDEFILLISLDGELRALFEEIVAELEQNPSTPS